MARRLQQLRDHAFSFARRRQRRFSEGVVQIAYPNLPAHERRPVFKDTLQIPFGLFNSLARLSREALVIRKYSISGATKAVELRKLDAIAR